MLLAFLMGVCDLAHAEQPALPGIDFSWTWVESPYGKPVIDRGPDGAWDHYAVDNPYVHVEKGELYCFFEGQNTAGQGWHEQIGLAISKDGLNWRKVRSNPLLGAGPAGSWDAVVAKLPAGVIKKDNTYYLFYSGRDRANHEQTHKDIGVATARCLSGPWKKLPGNPIFCGRDNQWDRRVSTLPVPIFQRAGKYWLLYRGMKGLYHHQGLGVAVSSDLLHWKRMEQVVKRPLIPVSHEIASMGITAVAGQYVGISQPMDLAKRRYWISPDLVHWTKGPTVQFKASVAAETISNPFFVAGQWVVLYEQKDRIYRAVLQPKATATRQEGGRSEGRKRRPNFG